MAIDEAIKSEKEPLSILVVEDDDSLRDSLRLNLEHHDFKVYLAPAAAQALEVLSDAAIDLVLCDLKMPNMNGIEFTRKIHQANPGAAVILMTAFGGHDIALQAIEAGATDYIQKPFELDDLILTIKKAAAREHLRADTTRNVSGGLQKYSFSNIIAQSESMKNVFETVRRLANFNTTVLITGESGTGKELLARAIHHNSPRRGKPFVAINCGAIPENLIESELFGHKAGAFTDATRDKRGLFEEASGGTIFLDEIGELPVHLQVKLLRVLQEQQIRRVGDELQINIDVRVIAATLRDLEDDVMTGRFRDDLYYRLNVVAIHLPPLRERPDDIPVLVQSFIKKHNKRLGLNVKGVTPQAMDCLLKYFWKGNVRELENTIERALVLTEKDTIDAEALNDKIRESATQASDVSAFKFLTDEDLSIKKSTRALELSLIQRALKKTNANRTHAAKILEISHRALLYKLKEYGLSDPSVEATGEVPATEREDKEL